MRRYRALALLLVLATACVGVRADSDFSDLSQTLEQFLTSGNTFKNITSLASLLGSSGSGATLGGVATNGSAASSSAVGSTLLSSFLGPSTGSPSGLLSSFLGSTNASASPWSSLLGTSNASAALTSYLHGLSKGDVLKKLATVATVGTIVEKSDFWEELKESMNSSEALFSSLPHTQNLIALAADFTNGTAELARDAWAGVKALEERFCTDGFAIEKEELPTACVGYNLTLAIGGGFCIFQTDKSIRCRKPSVRLVKTPTECFLKHHEATIIKTKECKVVKTWGKTKAGFLKPEQGPKTYNLTKALDDSGMLTAVEPMWNGVFSKLTSRLAKQYNTVQDGVSAWTDDVQSWVRDKLTLHIWN